MTCRTYTKPGLVLHGAAIVLLTAAGVLTAYSAVFALLHIGSAEDKIAAGFTIFFALLILSVDFFECRAMGAQLYMDGEGIGIRRFRRTKVFLPWDSIREVGTGSIPTPFGSSRRVYFSGRKLSEEERSDLVTLNYHTVHFSHIPKDWYREICAHLSVPIPEEVERNYVR